MHHTVLEVYCILLPQKSLNPGNELLCHATSSHWNRTRGALHFSAWCLCACYSEKNILWLSKLYSLGDIVYIYIYVHMCVCMHTYICVCMYVCMCVYVCMYLCMYVCMLCVCMYVYIYILMIRNMQIRSCVKPTRTCTAAARLRYSHPEALTFPPMCTP